MLENLDVNQQIAVFSAGSALLGSVIGAVATLLATWMSQKMQANGKLSLHLKMVNTKGAINKPWGFYRSQLKTGLFMQVPLWLDVCNTSGISRTVRNVNLYAYKDKKEVASFTQIQRIGDGDSKIALGDNESYTLVIPANSARRFDLDFMLHESDIPTEDKSFDELILTYFDEKNKIHAFHFVDMDQCWGEGALKPKKEWITLDQRCNYAR